MSYTLKDFDLSGTSADFKKTHEADVKSLLEMTNDLKDKDVMDMEEVKDSAEMLKKAIAKEKEKEEKRLKDEAEEQRKEKEKLESEKLKKEKLEAKKKAKKRKAAKQKAKKEKPKPAPKFTSGRVYYFIKSSQYTGNKDAKKIIKRSKEDDMDMMKSLYKEYILASPEQTENYRNFKMIQEIRTADDDKPLDVVECEEIISRWRKRQAQVDKAQKKYKTTPIFKKVTERAVSAAVAAIKDVSAKDIAENPKQRIKEFKELKLSTEDYLRKYRRVLRNDYKAKQVEQALKPMSQLIDELTKKYMAKVKMLGGTIGSGDLEDIFGDNYAGVRINPPGDEAFMMRYEPFEEGGIAEQDKNSLVDFRNEGVFEKGGSPRISYQKAWHPTDGTVYDQTIRIDKATYEKLKDAVASEIALDKPRKNEYVSTSGYEMYLKPLVLEKGNVVYLNHTQTRFINLFLKLNLKDRNTRLKVVRQLEEGGLAEQDKNDLVDFQNEGVFKKGGKPKAQAGVIYSKEWNAWFRLNNGKLESKTDIAYTGTYPLSFYDDVKWEPVNKQTAKLMSDSDIKEIKRDIKRMYESGGLAEQDKNDLVDFENEGVLERGGKSIKTIRDLAQIHPEMYDYYYKWRNTETPELEKDLEEVLYEFGYTIPESDKDIIGEYNDLKAYMSVPLIAIKEAGGIAEQDKNSLVDFRNEGVFKKGGISKRGKRVKLKSGLQGWRNLLRNQYDSFEEFEHYSDMYGLHGRLGYKTAQEAWEANPIVEGGTNPADFRKVAKYDDGGLVDYSDTLALKKGGKARDISDYTLRAFMNTLPKSDREQILSEYKGEKKEKSFFKWLRSGNHLADALDGWYGQLEFDDVKKVTGINPMDYPEADDAEKGEETRDEAIDEAKKEWNAKGIEEKLYSFGEIEGVNLWKASDGGLVDYSDTLALKKGGKPDSKLKAELKACLDNLIDRDLIADKRGDHYDEVLYAAKSGTAEDMYAALENLIERDLILDTKGDHYDEALFIYRKAKKVMADGGLVDYSDTLALKKGGSPNKKRLFEYWFDKEKNEPSFWQDRGEYNTGEMVSMAVDNFPDISEKEIEKHVDEYIEKHTYGLGGSPEEGEMDIYNDIVKALKKKKIDASATFFDKYQGIYITVPGVGKFWTTDKSYYSGERSDDVSQYKYRKAWLEDLDGRERYLATRGDYWNMPEKAKFENLRLVLVNMDRSEKVIKQPKKSDLPQDGEVAPLTFTHKPNTKVYHLFLWHEGDDEDVQIEITQKGNDLDISELVEYIKAAKKGRKADGGSTDYDDTSGETKYAVTFDFLKKNRDWVVKKVETLLEVSSTDSSMFDVSDNSITVSELTEKEADRLEDVLGKSKRIKNIQTQDYAFKKGGMFNFFSADSKAGRARDRKYLNTREKHELNYLPQRKNVAFYGD